MARRSHDLLVDEHAFQRQLQRKSGHRRKELLQLAKALCAWVLGQERKPGRIRRAQGRGR